MSPNFPSASAAATSAAVSPVALALDPEHERPPSTHAYSRLCGFLSKASLVLAIVGLIGIILSVQIQVVGRYVFNDTPTWAEALALQLVLYVTALGVAVGVRDAGHIGLESLVSLLPESLRLKLEVLIHALVALFGAIMVQSGWLWTKLKWSEMDPMLGMPVGIDYLSLVIAGILIVMFSIEHIIALLRDEEVVPSWY
jgi:TRAP-type C4-dicarboxylate transport system permease small subunit